MKQILQSLKTGKTEISEVPLPAVHDREVLVQTHNSLVSVGTERMLVEFGKAGWIEKAKQQPDKVKMVLDKIKSDGLAPTIESVFAKLEQPLPLGYCNAGKIMQVGKGVLGFQEGDRVVSNGQHAEFISVPQMLCAKIPDSVSDEEASFAVLGSIALQGIRLAKPTLGESVVVMGAGLIGLMTIQLLRAQGCRVMAVDFDKSRLQLASEFGAEIMDLSSGGDVVEVVHGFSRGYGADAVLITVSSKSNDPVSHAAKMSRKRGRIILIGVTGLELSRADFYEKELTFQVSCSYGPGRYDPGYEEKGNDYPIGFVRWTEQRNFQAVLDMMAEKKLNVRPLISHRYSISEAEKAYDLILSSNPSLGILLEYEIQEFNKKDNLIHLSKPKSLGEGDIGLSFIGSGSFATKVLIPAFQKTGVSLLSIASKNGVSGSINGIKFGFQQTTTDVEKLLQDEKSKVVVIASKHDSHAKYVKMALSAGKHVFVEKPLCLTHDELRDLEEFYESLSGDDNTPSLMVGYNRRFSPQIKKIEELLSSYNEPKSFILTVNAGQIPTGHWLHDEEIGGGRILGEGCHFIDLLRFLSGSAIKGFTKSSMNSENGDTTSIQLSFRDGSIGTIHYFANGSKEFPKERMEVFCSGKVLQLDNFRKLRGFGWPGFRSMNLWKQDKGHHACVHSFIESLREGKPSPISIKEIFEVTRVSIDLQNNLCS